MMRWIVAALLASACSGAPPAPREREAPAISVPPNVIVFLTDTERADRLGAYGQARPTSPVFDRFAREQFLFTHAYAPTSWTRPSVASLFTGTYPQRHGVQMRQDVLPQSIPVLAETLLEGGWRTYMVNTNPHITDNWGMTRGFEHAVHVMPHPDQFKAGNGANVVLRHVRQLMPTIQEPFFLYVHLIDPHYPFEPPQRDLKAVGVKGQTSLQRYDAEIHYSDRHLGIMLELLDDSGFLDNAMVMFTSDHGDEFHERGSQGHGKTLYQEVVKIPMALGLSENLRKKISGGTTPGTTTREGGEPVAMCSQVHENVSLVDVFPTVLDLVDLTPPAKLDGESLLPGIRCEPRKTPRPLFFSVEKERTSLAAILVDKTKLIVDRTNGTRRLFLLDENPGELARNKSQRTGMQELKRTLGHMLETFEWSVKPGLHIELAGLDDQKDRRHMMLRITTEGKIVSVKTNTLEPRDTYTLSPSGKTLWVNAKLTSFWHRSPKHVWVQDRDELLLEIDPPDAAMTVFAELDSQPAPGMQLRFPAVVESRDDWPVMLSHAQLLDTRSLVDRRKPGIYIYAQTPPQQKEIETVSKDITDALRVLGYIQ